MIPVACMPFLALVFAVAQDVFPEYDFRAIAAAQMTQESYCRPTAQSPYAHGLFQITPGTAGDLQNGICKDLGHASLYDIRWSITCGIRYDRHIWDRMGEYSPQIEQAGATLSAYNGGRGWTNRDNRVCQRTPGCNPSLYFDHVQYNQDTRRSKSNRKENRDYPDRIMKVWKPRYDRILQ